MSEPVIRAAGLIVFRELNGTFEFLMLQASTKNHWTPPKGENERTAAVRETEEEAGLFAQHYTILPFTHTLRYRVRKGPKTVVYWLAKLHNPNTPILLSHEHTHYEWNTLDSVAHKLKDFPDSFTMIQAAQKYLTDNLSQE